ncbi:p15-like protein [Metarhizium rileyi]|uniref:P15-like protein n=1 Tax=Metarhizium rileyi (strain RCEF 4871) TaxID=1649241 RepID=A0A167IYB7_METRR|nr:p15-like protein [Metarhizium rileyi RCEF 4871]TWU78144.1 hypothetical protein ED733_007499 [Metarhizium rileyi]
MRFNALLPLLLPLVGLALAAPASDAAGVRQPAIHAVTDHLLFAVTLARFEARRDAKDPASLDWASDGCTSSPDNPFGFPFLPGCHRHDFGYQNYRIQERFTKAAKAKIDSNFKSDLYHQCRGVPAKAACRALANVYYEAVKEFGGKDATKRDSIAYEKAVAAYDAAVKEAQEKGLLPVLD